MATYYINGTSGSESNDGLSDGAPKRDFSSSISMADGTIVRLACGTTITLTAATACTGNFTIESYGEGPRPKLLIYDYATSHLFANAPSKGPKFTVRGINIIRVDTGSFPAYGENGGISSIGGETLIAENNVVEGKFMNSIRVGWGDYSIVRSNTITGALNNGIFTGLAGASKAAPSYGLYAYNHISTPDCLGDPMTLHDGDSGGGIGNRILGNYILSGIENAIDTQLNYVDTYIGYNHCVAGPRTAETGSGNSVLGLIGKCTVEGNIIDSLRTTCLSFYNVAASGSIVRRNLMLGPTEPPPTGAQILTHSVTEINPVYLNNTLIGRGLVNLGRSMCGFHSATTTMVFKNNIVYKTSADPYAMMYWPGNTGPVGTFDNNSYYVPILGASQYCGKTLTLFKSTFGIDANSSETLGAPPLDSYYRLLAGSVFSGAGEYVGPSTDPAGTQSMIPPSRGAYEYALARTARM